jgi:hypothetical protein
MHCHLYLPLAEGQTPQHRAAKAWPPEELPVYLFLAVLQFVGSIIDQKQKREP